MTATYDAEAELIFGRLNTQWASATPIAWPNEGYSPTIGTSYIEPVLNTQAAFRTTVGTVNTRHPGLLTVNVRTELGQGDGEARRLGDTVAGIFSNLTVSGVTFRTPTVNPGRPDPDNAGWFRVQVDCPYYRDTN